MEQKLTDQGKMIGIAILGQMAFGIILMGVVLYDYFTGASLFGAPLGEGELFGQTAPVVWGISGFLIILYLLIRSAFRRVDETREMAFLRFWVRQIHRRGDSSIMALLLVPSSLGEAVVILSLILYLLGGREPVLFLPGMLLGIGGIVLSLPDRKVRDNMKLLDEIVRAQDNRHRF